MEQLELSKELQEWQMLIDPPLSGEDTITFGIHKGCKFKNTPVSYLMWLFTKTDLQFDESFKEEMTRRYNRQFEQATRYADSDYDTWDNYEDAGKYYGY